LTIFVIMIKPFCIQVSLLIETEEQTTFVPFFIQVEQIQGYFIADGFICVVISGENYNCEYDSNLLKFLRSYFTPMNLN